MTPEDCQRLAAIVESSDDAIVATDLDGRIITWNRGAERMFGYAAAEMIGHSSAGLVPPDRHGEEERTRDVIGRGERVSPYDTVRLAKDGRPVDVSLSASPICDTAGTIVWIAVIARDITENRQREREIARLSRLYNGLSQVNQAIVWTADRAALFQRVCRVLVEHAGFRMVWISRHDEVARRLVPVASFGDDGGYLDNIVIATDDRPEGHGPAGIAFREGRPFVSNDMRRDAAMLPWWPNLARLGLLASAALPIRTRGVVIGTLNVYADEAAFFRDKELTLLAEAADNISFALDNLEREARRREAEAVAQREKQFSDTLIESMPGILYVYDPHGTFVRWNRNFETVSGYSGEEIARMHPLDFVSDRDKASVASRIAAVFADGESFIETEFLAKNRSLTPYFFTGRRMERDGVERLVGMGIDISERKRAEAAVRELNETLELKVETRTRELQVALVRAESADQLKSAFLATMSHELRTPLNSIIGFTGIVLQGLAGPLTAEQQKQLSMVRTSARHLLELINDVLDLSKIEAGQLEVRADRFAVADAIDRVLAMVRPPADAKGLTLSASVSPDAGMMHSDRRRVEQILINLLTNAIKFTSRGSVTLTVDRVAGDVADGETAGGPAMIRFRVTDTGIGIKDDELEAVFQPFVQIDAGLARAHEGTGLGLAICRRLATLLGGRIAVSSKWTRGSVFTVILPEEEAVAP